MSKKVLLSLPLITALAPAGEGFTAEAVNEGVWLTPAHLEAVEGKLGANATAEKTASDNLTAANAAKKTAEDALATANTTIGQRDARIAELEAENAKLGGKPAATLQTTAPKTDTPAVDNANAGKSKYHTPYDDIATQYVGTK